MPDYDMEGLQVAFLAHLMPHYLDLETGEVIDVYPGQPHPEDPQRFRRIPSRTETSDAEDRRAFVAQLKSPEARAAIAHAVDDAGAFRAAVSMDRSVEKAWFSFKNDQATRAIEGWLKEVLSPES